MTTTVEITSTAYLADRLEPLRLRLTGDERRELVSSLADAGMPTRAIAQATGVGKSTVARDLAGVPSGTPDRQVTGRDGKNYTIPTAPTVDIAPRTQRRSSLPDSYRNAFYKVEKALESLQRLHADDRFLGHRDELKERHSRTADRLDALMSSINTDLFSPSDCPDCGNRVLPNNGYETRCETCRGEDR